MRLERHLGHFWDQTADREPIGPYGKILVRQHIFQLQAVHDWKNSIEQWLGHLKPNEIVALLRCITIFRDLHHVELELGFQMRGLVLRIFDGVTELRTQFRILDCDGLVDSRAAGNIGRIMCESAQREGILVGVLALDQ